MKILVTGATGLVGHAIAKKLAAKGETVTALVRDPDAAARKLSGVSLVRGDIVDPASLAPAMRDVELVFHAAGMPEQWQADERIFDRDPTQSVRAEVTEADECRGAHEGRKRLD